MGASWAEDLQAYERERRGTPTPAVATCRPPPKSRSMHLNSTPERLASIDSRLPLKRLFIGELDFDKDECAFDGRHLLSLAARFGNLEELHIDVPISVDFPELDSYFMVEKNCTKLKRLYFGWHELAQPVTSNAASLPHLYACLLAGFRDPHGRSRLASWSDADCVCGENTMAASQYLPF